MERAMAPALENMEDDEMSVPPERRPRPTSGELEEYTKKKKNNNSWNGFWEQGNRKEQMFYKKWPNNTGVKVVSHTNGWKHKFTYVRSGRDEKWSLVEFDCPITDAMALKKHFPVH